MSKSVAKRKMSWRGFLPAIVTVLLVGGCAMGGGSMGTGLVGGPNTMGPDGKLLTPAIEFTVIGTLLNANGYPMTGAKVSARTAAGQKDAISNKGGKFSLPVSMQSGEEIIFLVVSNKGRSSCSALISPAGEAEVAITLRLNAAGQLVCP